MNNCCGDSPLSIAGNVVGFFTFVLAAVAWWVALVAATRGALQEIEAYNENVTAAIEQIQSMVDYCLEQRASKDAIFAQMNAEFDTSLGPSVAAAKKLQEVLVRHSVAFKGKGSIFGWNLGNRLSWLAARGDVDRDMAKLLAKKSDLLIFQLTLILRKVDSVIIYQTAA